MRRSTTKKILTTHTGSLPRSAKVVEQLLEGNVSHGEGDYDNCAVIEEVRRRTR